MSLFLSNSSSKFFPQLCLCACLTFYLPDKLLSLQAFYQELSEMRLRAATAETEKVQQERSLKSTRVRILWGFFLCFFFGYTNHVQVKCKTFFLFLFWHLLCPIPPVFIYYYSFRSVISGICLSGCCSICLHTYTLVSCF